MSASWSLETVDEWTAHVPGGGLKPADGRGSSAALRTARGGYASVRVRVRGQGQFRLAAAFEGGLQADLYRAWYHRLPGVDGRPDAYYPDALVPARARQSFAIPDPDNAVPGQSEQEFWLDVYAPHDAATGEIAGRMRLTAGRETCDLALLVTVIGAVLPDTPCVAMDHNSYGARWLPEYYPKSLRGPLAGDRAWQTVTRLLHDHYRIAHEHRSTFHNLGYGHSGQFDPIYGPRTAGNGRTKALVDWQRFDAYHGPLLDGSAFRTAAPGLPPPRRPATPVWGIYTPINPDWPADYLWWGEPGYEVEFTRCVGQFDAHFREHGWTRSNVELFFNHKKRYRWFEWDGDEAKHAKDDACHLEMIRLWKQAIGDTPVPWVYRVDASWRMKWQFEGLAGQRNFWVCGGFCAWYPREVAAVLARGETVFSYGGYPTIAAAGDAVLHDLYRTWARGFHGFTEWLTTKPGRDPWFACDGAGTGAFYPGERFGVDGPLPSIRLKVLRNGIQDIDLLNLAATRAGNLEQTRRALTDAVGVPVWEEPPRAAHELPPEDWDNLNLQAEHEPGMSSGRGFDPGWWSAVRDLAFARAQREDSLP